MRPDVAMTGEISLRGLVLPVGGIKEKMIAAARAGIRKVILPARNKRDLEDIPQSAKALLEFVWVERVQEALEVALGEPERGRELALASSHRTGGVGGIVCHGAESAAVLAAGWRTHSVHASQQET